MLINDESTMILPESSLMASCWKLPTVQWFWLNYVRRCRPYNDFYWTMLKNVNMQYNVFGWPMAKNADSTIILIDWCRKMPTVRRFWEPDGENGRRCNDFGWQAVKITDSTTIFDDHRQKMPTIQRFWATEIKKNTTAQRFWASDIKKIRQYNGFELIQNSGEVRLRISFG